MIDYLQSHPFIVFGVLWAVAIGFLISAGNRAGTGGSR